MDKQQEYVLRSIEERDIRFIRLWFTDVLGSLKSVAIAPAELESAVAEGIGFDGSAIEGDALPYGYFVAKFAATFLSMISGIPGGIFAPSLSVGAGLGSSIGQALGVGIGLAAVLGMAGYFAGVVQAPMTAFVIILEMTDSHEGIISLMAAAMLGYLTSRMISREPLYHGLSRAWVAEGVRIKRAVAKATGEAQ